MSNAETISRGTMFEDMTVGRQFRTDHRTITETDLVTFITLGGFNDPLFWDARHAQAVGLAGRLVPGALVYSFAEGLIIQSQLLHGTGLRFLGMHLDVTKPVFVGDTIHAVVEITDNQPEPSGDLSIVSTRVSVRNQHGEEVLVFTPVRLVRGRDYVAR
jgi:acyl dehydratase